jgi:hypothetical protein
MRFLLLGVIAIVFAGCRPSAFPEASAGASDAPAAASAPRAFVEVEVDLPSGSACAQDFDVAVYKNTAIVMIGWQGAGGCSARRARVQFLSSQIQEAAVLELLKKHAKRVVAQHN